MTEALVGRYMRNNQTQEIVPINSQRDSLAGGQLGYKTPKRQVWVSIVRVYGTELCDSERLNGYTLLPADYRPEGLDVT